MNETSLNNNIDNSNEILKQRLSEQAIKEHKAYTCLMVAALILGSAAFSTLLGVGLQASSEGWQIIMGVEALLIPLLIGGGLLHIAYPNKEKLSKQTEKWIQILTKEHEIKEHEIMNWYSVPEDTGGDCLGNSNIPETKPSPDSWTGPYHSFMKEQERLDALKGTLTEEEFLENRKCSWVLNYKERMGNDDLQRACEGTLTEEEFKKKRNLSD